MSSRFSRRRTRVQQPPPVCKSKGRPRSPLTDNWPATIRTEWQWQAMDGMMQTADLAVTAFDMGRVGASHTYSGTVNDNNGWPYTLAIDLEKIPADVTVAFSAANSNIGPWDGDGTGTGWDDSTPTWGETITLNVLTPGILFSGQVVIDVTT